jgi:hypothetical protein
MNISCVWVVEVIGVPWFNLPSMHSHLVRLMSPHLATGRMVPSRNESQHVFLYKILNKHVHIYIRAHNYNQGEVSLVQTKPTVDLSLTLSHTHSLSCAHMHKIPSMNHFDHSQHETPIAQCEKSKKITRIGLAQECRPIIFKSITTLCGTNNIPHEKRMSCEIQRVPHNTFTDLNNVTGVENSYSQ